MSKTPLQAAKDAYRERDAAALNEQRIENAIFDIYSHHTQSDIDRAMAAYAHAKRRRMRLSLKAAETYMLLDPKTRKVLTEWWTKTKEGVRKGSEIQGNK